MGHWLWLYKFKMLSLVTICPPCKNSMECNSELFECSQTNKKPFHVLDITLWSGTFGAPHQFQLYALPKATKVTVSDATEVPIFKRFGRLPRWTFFNLWIWTIVTMCFHRCISKCTVKVNIFYLFNYCKLNSDRLKQWPWFHWITHFVSRVELVLLSVCNH